MHVHVVGLRAVEAANSNSDWRQSDLGLWRQLTVIVTGGRAPWGCGGS